MTDRFDDATLEQLNAYLDGEMDDAARAAFEARLALDPALREHLEQIRTVSESVEAEFVALPAGAPSEELFAAVKAFAAAHPAGTEVNGARIIKLEQRPKTAGPQGLAAWQLPVAAAVAFCVGAGAMWLVQTMQTNSNTLTAAAVSSGRVAEGAMLHRVLERVESGATERAGHETIRPILTFKAKDGRYCREFEAFSADGAVVGVACRAANDWRMEVLLSAAARAPDETQYAPASGFNARALDDVVSQLMDGAALDAAAEAEALRKGWQKSN